MNFIIGSKRNYFTKNQKLQILKELDAGGITHSDLARKHGIHPVTIHKWKRAMKSEKHDKIDIQAIKQEYLDILEENKMLKKALANMALKNEILQTANDVLKKVQVKGKLNWSKK